MTRGRFRLSPRLRLLLQLVVAGCLLLVVAELSLRTWARYARIAYETYDASRGTPALVPGRHITPLGEIEIDEQGFVARAPADATRSSGYPLSIFPIVALGDSCTFGAGDAESTYPAVLERCLRDKEAAALDFRVVNAGIAGLNSDEALGRLAYALEVVRPEVVTIYLGWNDLMKGAPRSQTRAALLSPLWREIDHLWLSRGLRKLLFYHFRARLGSPRTGADGQTGRFANFRPDHFEENLLSLIEETRNAYARPLLVTLPHSLRRDLQPMDLMGRRLQFPYFHSGNALGDFVDLIERYNEAIRRVGTAQAVPVADVAQRFDHVIRKQDYFLDTMHPNRRGNSLIAEVLERALRDSGLLENTPLPVGLGRDG